MNNEEDQAQTLSTTFDDEDLMAMKHDDLLLCTPVDTEETMRLNDSKKPSMVRALTGRVLDLIITELHSVENQKRLKEHIIHPLIKMLYTQMFPYVLVMCSVILIILLTSLCTCTMFALFFFRSRH